MLIRQNHKKKPVLDNRLNLILAVVLLLVGVTIFRLYDLQFIKYDFYAALASDQHQVYNKLEPVRGRIFAQASREFSDTAVYPLAANKEYALLYAVPKKINDASSTAGSLYQIFDQAGTEIEVDKMLDEDPYFASSSVADSKEKEEFRKLKRELEIGIRRSRIVASYYGILSKTGDPYEPLRSKVDEEQLKLALALNEPGLDYIMETHRYYPEMNLGSHLVGFVGYNGDTKRGHYGLEGFFNEELTGQPGSLKAERSASGELIIMNDREHVRPVNGSDLILTINHSIQFTACSKLNETALRHGADRGSVIALEPSTGAILAMCSWPDYDPNNYNQVTDVDIFNNPVVFSDYEPGSVFKIITMAASINEGKVTPQSTYEDRGYLKIEGWPKPIKNSDYESYGGHGVVDMTSVLENSLNTGAIFAMQRAGAETFARYVADFGFGEKTGVELEAESSGNIESLKRKTIRPVEAATASFGQGITVTPLQLAAAFAVIANGGILMKPYLVGEIVNPDGSKVRTQPQQIRRVISERTALLVAGMMVKVIEHGHAKRAAVKGYYVAGKTGTAQVADKVRAGYSDQTIHTFVGFAPVDDPKIVMVVRLDNPKDVRFADSSAAPLFGELAEFILNYYQVPKER